MADEIDGAQRPVETPADNIETAKAQAAAAEEVEKQTAAAAKQAKRAAKEAEKAAKQQEQQRKLLESQQKQAADKAKREAEKQERAAKREAKKAEGEQVVKVKQLVREGHLHAWIRTIAIVGIFAAFVGFFIYLAPRVAVVLNSAQTLVVSAEAAVQDIDETAGNLNKAVTDINNADLPGILENLNSAIGDLKTVMGGISSVFQNPFGF